MVGGYGISNNADAVGIRYSKGPICKEVGGVVMVGYMMNGPALFAETFQNKKANGGGFKVKINIILNVVNRTKFRIEVVNTLAGGFSDEEQARMGRNKAFMIAIIDFGKIGGGHEKVLTGSRGGVSEFIEERGELLKIHGVTVDQDDHIGGRVDVEIFDR